jgi:hypothetical protein
MTATKRIFAFLFLVAVSSCLDPYLPNLKNYQSLLVVEGLISNENSSYKIKLSRTISYEDSTPEKVSDANVNIIDGNGIKTHLQNSGDGYYKTDSTSIRGVIGQKYTLQILTSDGKEYKSEECTMLPVAGIDTLYYEKGEEFSGNPVKAFTGIKVFLNSADATGLNQYFRWTFEEVWKFIVPGVQRYTFIFINDTTFSFRGVPVVNDICWKSSKSGEIITNSILPGGSTYIDKQLIQFIAPVKSDRLSQQYSILVKQYSVSKKEYDFWNDLQKVNEVGGDIFNSQPYKVISNIHNVNDANEMVLGYFEVSAVSQKRMFITAHELDPLVLPQYKTSCVEIAKSPDDWPAPQPSWNTIYHWFTDIGEYAFVMPVVTNGTVLEGSVNIRNLVDFIFSPKVCAFCEPTGFSTKPDFWVDLE